MGMSRYVKLAKLKIFSMVMTHNDLLRLLLQLWQIRTVCRTFNKILTMMAIDWEKCSSTKFSMLATVCNAKLSQRFANMTMILYSIAVIFVSSKIFIKHADDGKVSNVSRRLLILEMDLPFDVNQRFVYELVIIAQFLFLLLCADASCLLNALLINLVSYYCNYLFSYYSDYYFYYYNYYHYYYH